MAGFVFRAEQFIPRDVGTVFEFFSRAENLQKITPEWLHFRIRSVDPNPVRKGTLIRYSLRWRVLPIQWTTQIVEWEPPYRFVDMQLAGPYRSWRHEHRFVAEDGGTRMFDEVLYELPFGVIGAFVHRLRVRQDVESIFAFRRQVVRALFEPQFFSANEYARVRLPNVS